MNKSQIINILTLTKAFLDEVSKMPIAYKSEATFTTAQGGIQGSLHEISCVISELVNDVKDELANGIEQDGWVNIKERLPNKDGKYLVHYQTQVLCDGRYLPKFDVVNYSSYIRHFDFYHDHITHWQPLTNPTNPPKQKEQQ